MAKQTFYRLSQEIADTKRNKKLEAIELLEKYIPELEALEKRIQGNKELQDIYNTWNDIVKECMDNGYLNLTNQYCHKAYKLHGNIYAIMHNGKDGINNLKECLEIFKDDIKL